jgi:UDP-glucose 4-epimerase
MCRTEPYLEEIADDAVAPRTEYGLSKLVGERLSKAYWKQYALPFTIWRPFNVIDPSEEGTDDQGVSHVFADLIYRLIGQQQNPLEVLGDGQQIRSFVHIREICDAIARFSFDDRTQNQIYNLGRNEPVPVMELAQMIYRKACARGLIRKPGALEFRSLAVPETDVRRRVGCFAKAKKELNWNSRISLDQALEDCLDSFQAREALSEHAK